MKDKTYQTFLRSSIAAGPKLIYLCIAGPFVSIVMAFR